MAQSDAASHAAIRNEGSAQPGTSSVFSRRQRTRQHGTAGNAAAGSDSDSDVGSSCSCSCKEEEDELSLGDVFESLHVATTSTSTSTSTSTTTTTTTTTAAPASSAKGAPPPSSTSDTTPPNFKSRLSGRRALPHSPDSCSPPFAQHESASTASTMGRSGLLEDSAMSLNGSVSSFASSSPSYQSRLHMQAKLKGKDAPPTPMRERRSFARFSVPANAGRRRPPPTTSSAFLKRPDCLRANSLATIYTVASAVSASSATPSHAERKGCGILKKGRFHACFPMAGDRFTSTSENRVTFDIPDDMSAPSHTEEDSINLSDCDEDFGEFGMLKESNDENQSARFQDSHTTGGTFATGGNSSCSEDLFNSFHQSMKSDSSDQFLEFLHTSSDSILSTVSSIEVECDAFQDSASALHQSGHLSLESSYTREGELKDDTEHDRRSREQPAVDITISDRTKEGNDSRADGNDDEEDDSIELSLGGNFSSSSSWRVAAAS